MNVMKVAKLVLAAGFVAASLMGQPSAARADSVPLEEVSFNYSKAVIVYAESKDTAGGRELDQAEDLVVETVESAAWFPKFDGIEGR